MINRKIYKSPDATTLFSSGLITRIPPKVAKKAFKYDIGDRVLIARRLGHTPGERKDWLARSSIEGDYATKRTYKIVKRALRSAQGAGPSSLASVYKLNKLSGWFYQRDLLKVYFERTSDVKDDHFKIKLARRRKKIGQHGLAEKNWR
jgi:hypothetical protein